MLTYLIGDIRVTIFLFYIWLTEIVSTLHCTSLWTCHQQFISNFLVSRIQSSGTHVTVLGTVGRAITRHFPEQLKACNDSMPIPYDSNVNAYFDIRELRNTRN